MLEAGEIIVILHCATIETSRDTMTRLVLVRHGETDWNISGRYQGQKDVPLNATGRQQEQALARRLHSMEIDAIYSSDLSRASDTAELIAKSVGKRANLRRELREVDVGVWCGHTFAEMEREYPNHIAQWLSDPARTSRLHGESYTQLQDRVLAFVKEILEKHQGQNVLIVTHGAVIGILLCSALGLDLGKRPNWQIDNGSISIIRFDDNDVAKIELINDVSHLPAEFAPRPSDYM